MGGDFREEVLAALENSRQKEKDQTSFYRVLAVLAELAGDEALSERFNALLADEQHHLSRLTARMFELGGTPEKFEETISPPSTLEGWEAVAKAREDDEVSWYEHLMEKGGDPPSMEVFREILESEKRHARDLAGKWMSA
jgi:rubrerythrin